LENFKYPLGNTKTQTEKNLEILRVFGIYFIKIKNKKIKCLTMNNLKLRIRTSLITLYRFLDVLALATALWIAFIYGAPDGDNYIWQAIVNPQLESTIFFAGVMLSWGFCLSSIWLYRSKRLAASNDEVWDVIKAVGFCTLILATMVFYAEWVVFPKRFLLIFFLISLGLLTVIRAYKRIILQQARMQGRNLRSVIVVGNGPRGQKRARQIDEYPEFGYHFLGFVDDVKGENVLGEIDQIRDILVNNVVDELIVCLPIKTFYEKMENIVKAAEEQGITVRVYSDLFNMRLAKAVPGEFGETPMLSLYTGPARDWRMIVKSVIDFVGASILLLILSPLLILITLLIRLTSKGPALFVQERVGYNKRLFKMYKFRTMVTNAEELQAKLESMNEASGPVFKIKNDPRVTPIGRFLRKTSLDELPQLFNVLIGDLSLVGPRPLPVRDVQKFDEYWFNRRFSIKPGITCVWQISGRSETSFDKWILQDLEYIDKWSLLLDLKILYKTPKAVIYGTGAM
jgi:exopolysaccharide biosynthesis polyprenyl glycosylphosphotransferase